MDYFIENLDTFIKILNLLKANPTKYRSRDPVNQTKIDIVLKFITELRNGLNKLRILLTALHSTSTQNDYNFGEFFANNNKPFRYLEAYNDIAEFYTVFDELINFFKESELTLSSFTELEEIVKAVNFVSPFEALKFAVDYMFEFYENRAFLVQRIFIHTYPCHPDYKMMKKLNEHVQNIQV